MASERDFFLENFSLLLRASMPVTEALDSLQQELRSRKMKRIVYSIEEEISAGAPLSAAFEKSGVLSRRFVSLLRIGEQTGRLSEQLALIIAEQKKEASLRSKIRSALIYPGFVLGITGIVGLTVVWYVFPQLTEVFRGTGAKLPPTTRGIIAIGNFFSAYGLIAVPLFFIVLAVLVFFLFIYGKTRQSGEMIMLHTPIVKTIVQEIELARFAYIMGTLLAAGISLPETLQSIQDSTSFVRYKRFYASILSRVVEGNSLYKSITAVRGYSTYMPPHIARLLLAGEMSGTLSETLLQVSGEYDQKVDGLTQNLSALLEPIIIVFVGIVVAVIALSVITPIYGLVNQIHN
jgi:type II secretory pathway component PulF